MNLANTLKILKRMAWSILVAIWLMLVVVVCTAFTPMKAQPFVQYGVASYYEYHKPLKSGKPRVTANGEIYTGEHMTAAHKTLPFGTVVRVTNTKNGKSTKVKINDRGPYIKGRIIDLSPTAFGKIGDKKNGVMTVKIETIGKTGDKRGRGGMM